MDRDFELWQLGDDGAKDRIITKFYEELKVLARYQLRRQRRTASLETADLQHLALNKILGSEVGVPENRDQLFALAATVMRRALIDIARSKNSQKRNAIVLPIGEDLDPADQKAYDVLHIDEALIRLKVYDVVQHDLVELKIFGGFSNQEVASILNLKLHQVKDLWDAAKKWMRVVINNEL